MFRVTEKAVFKSYGWVSLRVFFCTVNLINIKVTEIFTLINIKITETFFFAWTQEICEVTNSNENQHLQQLSRDSTTVIKNMQTDSQLGKQRRAR